MIQTYNTLSFPKLQMNGQKDQRLFTKRLDTEGILFQNLMSKFFIYLQMHCLDTSQGMEWLT